MGRRIEKALLSAVLLLSGLLDLSGAQAGALDSPACLAGGAPAVVASVDPRVDLHLADGRVVHLPGMAPMDEQAGARQALDGWLNGTTVSVLLLQPDPDRWGRTVALVFADPPGTSRRPVSVLEALVDAGLVLARPDPALEPCWPTLMRLERGAEATRIGLWRGGAAFHPGDVAGLQARIGSFVLVQGRVAAVREGRSRLYMRFAGAGPGGLAVTLTRPLLKRLLGSETDPHGWVGHDLRVRGLADDRWGLQIEVTSPQQIEVDPH